MKRSAKGRFALILPVLVCALLAGGAVQIVQDQCGPFTDVTPAFCPYILELYYLGITAGTSPTTFSPDDPLTRGQGAVFIAKGLNQSLARSSRRTALGQWWTTTPHYGEGLGLTALDELVGLPCFDGADVWVPTQEVTGKVFRVRASDGRLLETWTGGHGVAALCAMGRVFVAGASDLSMIDPSQPAGSVTIVAPGAGRGSSSLAFDGSRIWMANPVGQCACDPYPPGSISIVSPGSWTVQMIETGDIYPRGLVFDGSSMWATDGSGSALLRFDSSGTIVQTVPTGGGPAHPAFDGANIWVPNLNDGTVTVVRAATGEVLTTLTGNGLLGPSAASFDGHRVLVTSFGNRVSLWNAQDLTPIGNFSTDPYGGVAAASDGLNFWLSLSDFDEAGGLGRF